MKRLLLLRHAKSSWADPGQADKDRPLNKRGKEAAPLMGRMMAKRGYIPDLVLCSTARRTTETLDRVLPYLPRDIPVQYEDGLYLAGAEALITRARWIGDDADTVLFIGHNPGMEETAVKLARPRGKGAEAERRAEIEEKFPTAALAVLTFDTDCWKDVAEGGGVLTDFIRPRDL